MTHPFEVLPSLPEALATIDVGEPPWFVVEILPAAWQSPYRMDLSLGSPLFTSGQMKDFARAAVMRQAARHGGAAQLLRMLGLDPLQCHDHRGGLDLARVRRLLHDRGITTARAPGLVSA